MEFPTLVYRSPGDHFGLNGKTYKYKAINDASELSAATADGWSISLADACKTKDAAPTRAELEQKAKDLAIHFDGRTGDAKLAKLIAEALA